MHNTVHTTSVHSSARTVAALSANRLQAELCTKVER
jgi:hypothetical protein